ncbi:MAG: hypothetical protein QM775_28880 [Pirellulales bacterium]
MTHIHVTGDAYRAIFYVPRGRIFLEGLTTEHAHAYTLPVGVEYIARAIKAASSPQALLMLPSTPPHVDISRSSWTKNDPVSDKIPIALYEVNNEDQTTDFEGGAQPVLRLSNMETQAVIAEGYHATDDICGDGLLRFDGKEQGEHAVPAEADVLVHWLGELAGDSEPRKEAFDAGARPCKVHVQIGLAAPLGEVVSDAIRPERLAAPSLARVLVVNVGEISSAHRVRRSLSYEAIAVDLLRFLRGDNAKPELNCEALESLSIYPTDERLSVLVVRINSSAVFLYACRLSNIAEKDVQEHALLLCHKDQCAPLSQAELSQMAGYTGFVSAQIAASVAARLTDYPDSSPSELFEPIVAGVRRSLSWQRTWYDRGLLPMLLAKDGRKWRPTSSSVKTEQTGYETMFADIAGTLEKQRREFAGEAPVPDAEAPITRFDALIKRDVLCIPVQIKRAVAHRTQWFMARSVAAHGDGDTKFGETAELGDDELSKRFREVALGWLKNSSAQPHKLSIPTVMIGNAELTDRREIEDFLAIHQALTVYATSHESKPLNIAVFGAPAPASRLPSKKLFGISPKPKRTVSKKSR